MENKNKQRNAWRIVTDILMTEIGTDAGLDAESTISDLAFDNGDFVLADATRQHQQHNLLAGKGDLRAFPQAGINLIQFISGETAADTVETQSAVELQLELDGQTIKSVIIGPDSNDQGKIQIDAGWESK